MSEKNGLLDPEGIILSRWYNFRDAVRFIPGFGASGHISLKTLYLWRAQELFVALYRPRGKKQKSYFIKGADIVKLIGVEPKVVAAPATARPRASSREKLAASGFKNV